MIILEGPDNAGKTTLGEMLSKDLGYPVVHSEKPNPEWTNEQALEHSRRQLVPNWDIKDRIYALSEYVYGPICRGFSALGPAHGEALQDYMNRPYLTIYCRPSDKTILANNGRDQMEGVIDNHKEIIESYDRLMEEMKTFGCGKIITYDWQAQAAYNRLLSEVGDFMKTYHSRQYSGIYMNMTKGKYDAK